MGDNQKNIRNKIKDLLILQAEAAIVRLSKSCDHLLTILQIYFLYKHLRVTYLRS